MASKHTTKGTDEMQNQIKCVQIKLQHPTAATANLMKYIADNKVYITCIQEPHTLQRKVAGIPKHYKTLTAGEERSRAAVIITNNRLDTVLITQLSDADTVAVEIISENSKIILASTYFGRGNPTEIDLVKIEAILQYAKGAGVLLEMDSNSRSTLWHDTLTNTRGKILEEFTINKQLYIMKEASSNTTFRNRIGTSNIDLTVINSRLLRRVSGWEISEEEGSSDHSIITYAIGKGKGQTYVAKT